MTKKHQNRPRNGGKSRPAPPLEGQAFAESRLDQGGLGQELTQRQMIMAMADFQGLPNPDPILRAEGKSISTYRSMVDGHLSSVMGKRLAAVSARPWSIERGKASARATAKTQEIFENLDVREFVKSCLKANGMGVSLQESVWGADDWIIPVRLIERPPEWFRFGLRGEVRFLDDGGRNEIVPPRKILVARHGGDFLNPYGHPILSECFWPLALKRGGLRLWMLFCEKFGLPKTIGKVPANTPEAEKHDLLMRLEAMVRAAAAVIPIGSSVELLETKVSGNLPFPGLVKWADSEMSKAWLGETLSTELQGNSGSRAAAQVHNEVRADLAQDDANLVEAVANQLISWIWEINSVPGPMPWFAIQMPEDLQSGRIQRDQGLYMLGWRPSALYFEDTYNIAKEHTARIDDGRTGQAAAPDPGAAFGEPDPAALEELTEESILQDLEAALTPHDLQDLAEPMVGPILDLAGKCHSFAEFQEGLVQILVDGSIDVAPLEDALARMTALASGLGGMRA